MNWRWLLLSVVGLSLLVGAMAIGREPGEFDQWVWLVIGYQIVGGVLVVAATWAWRAQPLGRAWLLAIALVGISLRLAVLPADRQLSDDAARYHWDGKAVAHAVNPYLFSPDDPGISWLRGDAIDEDINHPWNRTCYPPLAEALFAVSYRLSPGSLRGWQWLCLIAEITGWAVLARELARRRRTWAWLLPLIWSPLLVCQGYLPGHVDLLTLPFVALLLGAVREKKPAQAGIWLACACLVKPLPLIILPAIGREFGLRRSLQLLAVFGLLVLAAYLPFRAAGLGLFTSTWLMATDWSFNGSLAHGLELVLPMTWAHLAAGILAAAGFGIATCRGRDFHARAIGAYLVFVTLTPTLFPWYLVSALPLLVLRPHPALLGLTILIPLADQVVIGHQMYGVWREVAWVRWLQYLPFYGLLAWQTCNERCRWLQPRLQSGLKGGS